MCRFTAYLGPGILVSSLVTEPHHSIIHQSYHAKERIEPLNEDGFGIGWLLLLFVTLLQLSKTYLPSGAIRIYEMLLEWQKVETNHLVLVDYDRTTSMISIEV